MTYNLATPVDIVFNQVEDLIKFGEMATCPFSAGQTINIAYTIINKTKKFKDGIITWNRKPPGDKNWVNVKTHFRQAHDELAEAGDLTMENAGYHQANLVVEMVGRMADIFPFREPANATIAEAQEAHA